MADSGAAKRANLMGSLAAVAATFTALVAVVVAIWDNVETRKHNRLSVLPYIVLDHVRNDSGLVTRGTVQMSNAGVGPALLHGLEITFRTEAGTDTIAAVWGAVAPLISIQGVQIRGWAEVDSGTALGVQQMQTLLRIQARGEDAGERVQRVLDGLRLRLRYASVYGDVAETTLGSFDTER